MKVNLLKSWDRARTSFWFLPAAMALAAVLLSFLTVALDRLLENRWPRSVDWAYAGGAEGASSVLETIAGSMITVAGVVFSLTLVTLSLASSQYGPRLLRSFMRDTSNQVVLGTFVATFLYCLMILRTIRFTDGDAFVPHFSVTLGLLFAVASLGVLIYFIHHISVSIQADQILSRVSTELLDSIDSLFPEQIGIGDAVGQDSSGPRMPDSFERESHAIQADKDGYLQLVDPDGLMRLAADNDLLVRAEYRPGDYVIAGTPLARVWPGERLEEQLKTEIAAVFALGGQRTPVQDIEYTVGQLVEVAVRAMSPGVNDPFTAITCVDRLGSALFRLAQRRMPSPCRFDAAGRLRVVAPPTDFVSIADAAFDELRACSRSNATVTARLLKTIARVAAVVRRAEDRDALLRHAEVVTRGACAALPEEEDRRRIQAEFKPIVRLLGRHRAPGRTE